MTPLKSLFLGAVVLAGSAFAAEAQYYYPNAYTRPWQTPPAWSYDPYTSGAAPCPQGLPDESRSCSERMPPTYGQPNFWPR